MRCGKGRGNGEQGAAPDAAAQRFRGYNLSPAAAQVSSVVRPQVQKTTNNVNLFLAPQMQGVMASILQILAPYPEARKAIADALASGGMEPRAAREVIALPPPASPHPSAHPGD